MSGDPTAVSNGSGEGTVATSPDPNAHTTDDHPSTRDRPGMTRTSRTRSGDLTGLAAVSHSTHSSTTSAMPATAAIMDTNTDSDNISTTQSSTARSNGGARGPLGPRPGVYRPCARCRVKKTKCDRSKPICSSCVKAGPDVICLYDNDELTEAYDSTSGAGLATAVLPMSTPATETKKGSDHQSKKATAAEGPHRGRKVVGVTAATTSAPRSSNGHTTRGGGDNSNNNTNGAKSVTAFSSQASSGGKRSGDVPPPSKKL
ncbi:hypothetical protein BC939DRAFT_463402, partial [Gamsiella multidivaricata]|uniref:uncharacterized protein n=1 Tax=Gamsiella multidivaricata TaxID=101098 RepID=UPI00221FDAAB